MTAHDDEDEPVHLGMGSATPGSSDADDDEYPVATLWLPDPETRRGWGMRHVWREKPKTERSLGFRYRKPG